MRTFTNFTFLFLASSLNAAPALGEKPPRWEYAELIFQTIAARPARAAADGTQLPATPETMRLRWTTGSSEIDAKSWAEMAEKLKAIGFKKDGPPSSLRMRFLNFLGSEGWELTGIPGPALRNSSLGLQLDDGAPVTWMLKRRVP